MTIKEIIDGMIDVKSEMQNAGFNRINIFNQEKEMLIIAYQNKTNKNNNFVCFEDKREFEKKFGFNPFIVYFSVKIREMFEKLIKLNENDFKKVFEKIIEEEEKSLSFRIQSTTPTSIHSIVMGIVKGFNVNSCLDICSGYGLILGSLAKLNENNVVKGYEINASNAYFSRAYLNMCGAKAFVEVKDVLASEMNEKYDLVFCDIPFISNADTLINYDSETIKVENIRRVSPVWSFVYKVLNSIEENGKGIVIVPNNILFRNLEIAYREALVNKGMLEAVINLPVGIMTGINVGISILILSHNNLNVSFIDASKKIDLISKRDKRINVDEILELWNNRLDKIAPNEVKVISNEEIKEKDFYLDVDRYVTDLDSINLKNPKNLKDIAILISGYQYTSRSVVELEHNKGNVSVLRISNILDDTIDYDSTPSITIDEKKVERFVLKDKDIVVTTKGTVIKAAIFNEQKGEIYIAQSNISVIRVIDEKVIPEYILAYINGITGRKLLEKLQRGIAISSISMRDLENFTIPLLSENDQILIANKYQSLKNKRIELLNEIDNINKKCSIVCEEYIKNNF